MSNTFDLIATSRDLAAAGNVGFDDDESYAEWERALADLGDTAAEKALARRHAELTLRDQAAALKALAAEVADRAKRIEAQAERVEQGTLALVREVLDATGGKKLTLADGSSCTVQTRQTVAVVVDAEQELPAAFVTLKPQPNKAEIKAAIEAGFAVPGARLQQNESTFLRWGK